MSGTIQVVTAAAGAGKTTRIVDDIAADVGVRPPEEILATTFTIRAADELVQRARSELFRQGRVDLAGRLLGARFGTVNAVCGQIVTEYALELGRSTSTNVIADMNESLVFAIAADAAIGAHAAVLNELAESFGHDDPHPPGREPPDWRRTVRSVLALARANGIGAEAMAVSAERSEQSFTALLPPAAAGGETLDAVLAAAVAAATAAIPAMPSATANNGGLPALRAAHARLSRGERLTWSAWAALTKVKCAPTKDGRSYADALSQVAAAAGRHGEHPRLRSDGARFIREIFLCAKEALQAYQSHKAERGLVDFTDQEALALQVLQDPALSARLRERISRVFVDEFQDSSPLQLAVFTALAEIVDASTWVGDPKQAIYAFRGADTDLTQAAFEGAADAAAGDVLSVSWRSRPDIVRLANAAFGPAFERMGLPAKRHAFSRAARSDNGFDRHALACWPLIGKVEEQAAALAQGLSAALADGAPWSVERPRDVHRPLRVGDIAVLCRTNTDVARYAAALSREGLPVAVERTGLARTPHVELSLAAYRWIADRTERLALAEMARFFAADPESDAWLQAAAQESDDALQAVVPIASALSALRDQILNLTPAELLDAVLALPELIGQVERWGDHAIRLDDLEALRGYARAYEAECMASGAPATPSGLLLALKGADPKRPPSLAADAIQVLTYHGAKGLEWPMVVLTGLAWESRARLFEPTAEVDGKLDWRHPLANRWIRFWPWPYGLSGSGSGLDANAAASQLGQAAWRRAVQEDTRLLYVGVTRARDYLVLAPPARGALNWLKVLDEPGGSQHVNFPVEGDNLIRVGTETFIADVRPLVTNEEETLRAIQRTHVRSPTAETSAPRPLHLRPSEARGEAEWTIVESISLGSRLRIDGVTDMASLGEAMHAVLAYDDPVRSVEIRRADAHATLERWGIQGFSAVDAIEASDRLHAALAGRWPGAKLTREVPVVATLGDQLVDGRIDLLAETSGGFAIIDDKSFPGAPDLWSERALQYAPQLALYGEAVQAVTGRLCDELFVHMPIVGALLRLARATREPTFSDSAGGHAVT
jgi:ATP-dependent helicase/nuclease subunit A